MDYVTNYVRHLHMIVRNMHVTVRNEHVTSKALSHHVIMRTNHMTHHVTSSSSVRSHDGRLDPPEQLYKPDLPRP